MAHFIVDMCKYARSTFDVDMRLIQKWKRYSEIQILWTNIQIYPNKFWDSGSEFAISNLEIFAMIESEFKYGKQ